MERVNRRNVADRRALLRSCLRDDAEQDRIAEGIGVFFENILGRAAAARAARHVQSMSIFLYNLLTIVAGVQTLGDEMCNLTVFAGQSRSVSVLKLLLASCAEALAPYTPLSRVDLSMTTSKLVSTPLSLLWNRCVAPKHLRGGRRFRLVRAILSLRLFSLLCNTFFLLFGPGRIWLCAVGAVKSSTVRSVGTLSKPHPFTYIGILSSARLAVELSKRIAAADGGRHIQKAVMAFPGRSQKTGAEAELPRSQAQCTLCLHTITAPACPPCGHLFCWDCILEWVATKGLCPLCRAAAAPQQIRRALLLRS